MDAGPMDCEIDGPLFESYREAFTGACIWHMHTKKWRPKSLCSFQGIEEILLRQVVLYLALILGSTVPIGFDD